MTTWNVHKVKADHNEQFAGAVSQMNTKGARFVDWEAITLFYAAVQLVDAYLAKTFNEHPTKHVERERGKPRGRSQLVDQRMHLIYTDYRQLQSLSTIARYFPDRQVTTQQVGRLWSKHYQNIKAMVDAVR